MSKVLYVLSLLIFAFLIYSLFSDRETPPVLLMIAVLVAYMIYFIFLKMDKKKGNT
ncbi:hypothetical protein [Planococcus alpniumensis]|uniref:hypothetical protein n=1 Tax=Planococcus alpniumensis TaxID=2708345 RepID=UPI001B8BFBF9|nr:hypothetical protein [Planococcus sp. MSAK28401]